MIQRWLLPDFPKCARKIKGGSDSSVATISGGGARFADGKVIQHIGYGTVSIDNFYVQDFGKLYRACGNCATKITRHVSVSNVYAVSPTSGILTVNKNYNDTAILRNITAVTTKKKLGVCVWSQAVTKGEPVKLGQGPSPPLCQYEESDITIVAP